MNDLTTPMSYPELPQQPRQSPISQPFPRPMAYPLPPVIPPPPPKRRAGLVLVIACAVAFAAAAVFAGLYVAADGDHDAAVVRLEQRKKELADVRARIGTAEEAQSSAESHNGDLEAENATLTTCVEAVQHYLWDGLEGDARTPAFNAMYDACQ
jgi:ferric-dicitrate binding protein FerR (iron transport regulator)